MAPFRFQVVKKLRSMQRFICAALAAAAAALGFTVSAATPAGSEAAALRSPEQLEAYKRWEESPHGKMLRRILPPGPKPSELPEPVSAGAKTMARYCVQCHYLPSPAMHTADKWPGIVNRMHLRMQGKGNLGTLMKDMMGGVESPSDEEVDVLVAYLRQHAQEPIDRAKYPDLGGPEGRAFDIACSQCHALPDPKRHTAQEWPDVVKRMRKHLDWIGTVRGREANPDGELEVGKIVGYLKRHARAE